jgi:hypothetical protein
MMPLKGQTQGIVGDSATPGVERLGYRKNNIRFQYPKATYKLGDRAFKTPRLSACKNQQKRRQ